MIDEVPGYRILQRAGEGGFSVVYRAHQTRLDRIVALKVLSVDAVDDDTMRRFERECQITGRLTGHPNVVTVLDTGMTSGGRPYISMDYFEHGSLRDRLSREGPLPVPDVLRIGVKIAGALAATHEAEVLHRDVKPQNILVSRYGEPALADFGVARLVDSAEATHTNAFTPHHAAPEVVNGDPPGVTSDIYALASTMYQLLAGGPAFRTATGSGIGPLMMRILNEPPPPIKRSDLPPQVFEVISKAMAKAPGQRFPSAVAFAGRLQQLQVELRLPVTELARSGAVSGPPGPVDHSGFTGPGLDMLIRSLDPHLPAAHPDASGPPPAPPSPSVSQPSLSQPSLSQPSVSRPSAAQPPVSQQQPARPMAPPPAPPRPQARQTAPPATTATPQTGPAKGGSRRGLVISGVLAVLLAGTGAGVGGVLLLGGGGGGDKPAPPTTSPTSATSPSRTAAPAVPSRVLRAAMPRSVRAIGKGQLVSLHWRLMRGNDYPIMVQQADETGSQTPQALPKHTLSTTISGLNPAKGYCFTVGAIVALGQSDGQPATIAWARPACIRGATAH
ncbi:serine/threonine-protein kinase [Actinomadura sp. DC4]|uniref:serine/threonine-protein kinase n=1 Tax=Actinomadura sp. DC4 TaxID=3055069 RepID=UPI0025B11173|nr:serine/threonine-protein kinase [Actinomadura sp. DC4]MDN3357634.1 serine/threonine-protein kinase [Actinomadura sp. DC4]